MRSDNCNKASLQSGSLRSWMCLGLVFSLVWLLLTGGDMGSWIVGILAVPYATWCALSLRAPRKVSRSRYRNVTVSAALHFVPYFLWQSLCGGAVSAMFAIHPRRRVQPGFMCYTTRLPEGSPRLFLFHLISLLPGTVSANWRDNQLLIHALDTSADNAGSIRQCEVQVARLFGLELDAEMAADFMTSVEER